jgi:hypothetical protein
LRLLLPLWPLHLLSPVLLAAAAQEIALALVSVLALEELTEQHPPLAASLEQVR